MNFTAEHQRLREAREQRAQWRKWGPYVSERQWGTVREDYSDSGNAWDYFTHDQARSRAYRWGEDGIAGICDDEQQLCFALALWNGRDPILKERLFGVTNSEGNHGEDVKEYYFYLDSTPTHSFMRYLYKYPQAAYPYADLVWTNRKRSRTEREYELLDTGVFDGDRYFDVFVEYAKASPEEILISIAVWNRGPESAQIHVLPTLWFRNTWAWGDPIARPLLRRASSTAGTSAIAAEHAQLGARSLYCEGDVPLLFTENETNQERIFGKPNLSPYVKDAFHRFVVDGKSEAVNPALTGTKAAAHYQLNVAAGGCRTLRLRLVVGDAAVRGADSSRLLPFGDFDQVLRSRRAECDEFYAAITPPGVGDDKAQVMRQALAGMFWSKQCYSFDLNRWLAEHHVDPLAMVGTTVRNRDWFHMVNDDVISMPDKWEYPWYAAWDLGFHTVAISMADLDFAKDQLRLMLREQYLHPSGQIPAYEWNFGDVNPPVHAWSALFLYNSEKALRGVGDVEFLKGAFAKLMLNFTWWVNRKDRTGRNVFEGGFLGLDNIGVFDRSSPLPTGGYLEQADGTAWMALFCQNMLEIAVELAVYDRLYEDMALKFMEHFFFIAAAINRVGVGGGQAGLWDEEDGFYYDVLRFPDGNAMRLKVRSVVGLLPLCATTVVEEAQRKAVPRLLEKMAVLLQRMPGLKNHIHPMGPENRGVNDRGVLSLVNPEKLKRMLARMLDETEFLSPYGLRALSRHHADHPYSFDVHGQRYQVSYLPAESDSGMFGGNSNWRGPIWMPMNVLLIRALLQFYLYYGDSFKVECPTGSGRWMNLFEVSRELGERLSRIFLRDEQGRRPVFGGTEKFQSDPHWRDHLLFYEYFHGDNGAGLGASHQTGWTGCIARLIQLFGYTDPQTLLEGGKRAAFLYEQP